MLEWKYTETNLIQTMNSQQQPFNRMKESVLAVRPILREIFETDGAKSLYDYAQTYFDYTPSPYYAARNTELIEVVRDETARLLGSETADSVARQLGQHFVVNTADHHGPLSQTYFVNSNAVLGMAALARGLENVVVFSAANVALNNASYPRGFLYHQTLGLTSALSRILVIPNNARPNLVYGLPAYTAERITEVLKTVHSLVHQKILTEQAGATISELLQTICADADVLACTHYTDQITKMNALLWKRYFSSAPHLPNLVYLPIEQIVSNVLIKHHLTQETIIHRLLFDPAYQAVFARFFAGVQGGVSLYEKTGTYLFWVLPKGRSQRMRLHAEGQELVSQDGSWRIPLEPAAIQAALESCELIPGLAIDFVVLAFYYGLQCLGGFSQVNYLSEMKDMFWLFLQEVGETEMAKMIETVHTNKLCDNFSIAYLRTDEGTLEVATGLDLTLYAKDDLWELLLRQAKTITVEQAVDTMTGDSYRYIHPSEESRDPELLAVTEWDIIQLIGLAEQIEPINR